MKEIEQLYEDLPPDEPRSRAEPYRELILRWRRQGRSYRRIREWLAARGVEIGITALHEFVQRRSRPRKGQLETLTEPAIIQSVAGQPISGASACVRLTPRQTPEEGAAARAALRASFDKPLFPNKERKKLFVPKPGPILNLNLNNIEGDLYVSSNADAGSDPQD
jgi:hypothetical protein